MTPDPAAVEKMARHLASVAYRPSGASVSNVEWSEVGETERQQFHRMARHVLSRLAVVEAERDLEQRQATFDRETTRLTIESMRLVTAERDEAVARSLVMVADRDVVTVERDAARREIERLKAVHHV